MNSKSESNLTEKGGREREKEVRSYNIKFTVKAQMHVKHNANTSDKFTLPRL